MSFLFSIFAAIIAPFIISQYISLSLDKRKVGFICITFGFIYLIILYIVNAFYPYHGTGFLDDRYYFQQSLSPLCFESLVEQPGYTWLLRITRHFHNHDLLAMKSMNIFSFLCTSLIWYRIGCLFKGYRFRYLFLYSILYATPFYWFFCFLLKDINIIFLTSLYLYALLNFVIHKQKLSLLMLSLILLAFFRIQLLLIYIPFLLFALYFYNHNFSYKKLSLKNIFGSVLLYSFLAIIIIIGSNENILSRYNVGRNKTLALDNVQKYTEMYLNRDAHSQYPIIKHIMLYFIIETSGFSAFSMPFNTNKLRGVLSLSMIIVFPFLFISLKETYKRRKVLPSPDKYIIIILTVFLILYLILSIVVGDSARWRMPALTAFMALSALGFYYFKYNKRLITNFFLISFFYWTSYAFLKIL